MTHVKLFVFWIMIVCVVTTGSMVLDLDSSDSINGWARLFIEEETPKPSQMLNIFDNPSLSKVHPHINKSVDPVRVLIA